MKYYLKKWEAKNRSTNNQMIFPFIKAIIIFYTGAACFSDFLLGFFSGYQIVIRLFPVPISLLLYFLVKKKILVMNKYILIHIISCLFIISSAIVVIRVEEVELFFLLAVFANAPFILMHMFFFLWEPKHTAITIVSCFVINTTLYFFFGFNRIVPYVVIWIIITPIALGAYYFSKYSYKKTHKEFLLTEELRKLNNKLSKKKDELTTLNKTKDKFFSIIAHDLRSPYNASLGFLKMFYEDYEGFSENEKREIIKSIYDMLSNNFNLTNNLLDWATLQQKGFRVNKEENSIKKIIDNAVQSNSSILKTKNIELKKVLKEDYVVSVDIYMTETILRNLINNALKFTPNCSSVNIIVNKEIDYLKISILDQGKGFSKDQIKNNNSGVNVKPNNHNIKKTSYGLGLKIAKEFSEIQDMRLSIYNHSKGAMVVLFVKC